VRKLGLIVKREYLTRVRTKGFVLGTIIVPVLGAAFSLLTIFLATQQPAHSMRIAIVDNSGTLAEIVSNGLDAKFDDGQPEFDIVDVILRPASPDAVQQDLRARINASKKCSAAKT
jgi:ABC-type Na+ efflux pump permease subunit